MRHLTNDMRVRGAALYILEPGKLADNNWNGARQRVVGKVQKPAAQHDVNKGMSGPESYDEEDTQRVTGIRDIYVNPPAQGPKMANAFANDPDSVLFPRSAETR